MDQPKDTHTDEVFSNLIKHIPCLAFLKPEEIPNAFANLKTVLPPENEEIIKWFDKYYVRFRYGTKADYGSDFHVF